MNIVQNVGIKTYNVNEVFIFEANFLTSIIENYKHHPSVKTIKIRMEKIDQPNFNFIELAKSTIVKEIEKLNPRKITQSNNILTKVIREFSGIFATIIDEGLNKCLNQVTYPQSFKTSDIISDIIGYNYRPIIILPNFSKIYER